MQDEAIRTRELKNCGSVKAMLMLLIVLYHSMAVYMGSWGPFTPAQSVPLLGHLARWLNSFHIYAFALVSGYLFYYLKQEQGRYAEYLPFLENKARRLLVPYITAAVFWVVPVYVLFSGTDGLVENFLLCRNPSQLWFLWMLFWVFAWFWPMAGFCDRHPVWGCVLAGAFYGLSLVGGRLIPNYFGIWNGCRYIIFFYMGFLIRKFGSEALRKIPWILWLVLDVALYVSFRWTEGGNGAFWKLMTVGLEFACHGAGAVAAFVILQKLADRWQDSRCMAFLGDHSMQVYLLHQQIIWVSLYLCNGRLPALAVVSVNFVCALGLSLGLSLVLSRWKWTRRLLGGK